MGCAGVLVADEVESLLGNCKRPSVMEDPWLLPLLGVTHVAGLRRDELGDDLARREDLLEAAMAVEGEGVKTA